jgi:glycosyltransferase involved in cell wall biosynthesis
MKIALIVPGGVDRSGTHRVIPCLLWLIERLAATDEVHVFALSQEPGPGRWTLLGAEIHNAGRWPVSARLVWQLAAEHRRGRFDVVHAFWASTAAAAVALARRMLGVPLVLHLPGGDLTDLPEIGYGGRSHWRGRLSLRIAAAGASRILAPSNYVVQQGRAMEMPVERVPFGVALDRWPPREPRRRDPGRPARLLHVGSLNRVKDQETLLLAAAHLRRAGVDLELDVIGEDTLDGAVHRRAAELGLDEVVTFRGYLPHGELRPWVERAHLLVVTSRHEAGPLVLLEAAVAGVPTAGTAVGHLADWAPDAAAAVPVGDAPALAAEITRLLADEEARLRMAAQAQQRALAEDADYSARTIRGIYSVLGGR